MPSVKLAKPMSRAALLGAALAAAVAVSGCSAGQVTQTDTQVPPVTGSNGNLADADNDVDVGLRDITVEFNSDGYGEGASAPLAVRIFNSSTTTPVTLTGVESADAEVVTLVDAPTDEETSDEGAATDEETESPTDEETSNEGSTTDEERQGSQDIEQEVAPGGNLQLTTQHEQYLQVEGLSKDINPGGDIMVTFQFGDYGHVDMTVPMAMPADAESRSTAEFEDDEHH